jgi:hypothetical protein
MILVGLVYSPFNSSYAMLSDLTMVFRLVILLITFQRRLAISMNHSRGGTLLARVAVVNDATPAELWAADKMARTLSLPLVRLSAASPVAAVAQIAVGYGAATALGASPSALSRLGGEGFFISTAPGGSAIVASSTMSARGTINGVFRFLNILGFRFFSANVTRVPKEKAW